MASGAILRRLLSAAYTVNTRNIAVSGGLTHSPVLLQLALFAWPAAEGC
jgi:hypothetical protein